MLAQILSKPNCAYCTKAKNLLQIKGVNYKEIMLGVDITREELLEKYPHFRTVPQIWVNDELVGTYENLVEWLNQKETNGVQLPSS